MTELRTAGALRRAAALAVDGIFAACGTALGFATGLFDMALFRVPSDWFWTEWWFKHWLDTPEVLVRPVLGFALFLLLWTAGFEGWRGRTPGDDVFGLRVVDAEGNALSLPQVGLRALGAAVNVATLGLGWLWIIVSPTRRGLHDAISATRVVLRR